MSRLKPTRLPTRFLLLPLVFLAGCAHQPVPQSAAPATPIPVTPLAPDTTPAPDLAAAAPASAAVAPSAGPSAAASGLTAGENTDSIDAADLPGPPADSLVTVRQADLFERLRGGFQLQDVDEPAVDSQLNWFANHPDFLERTFGRAELWMYYIVGQLEQRNMPRELALLPVIESAFEPYAYSRARASGLWQFVSDTGRRFGLKQDWWYDGRRDPIEATRAALDYLQALHDEFNGDWLLAIAAYNCGELAVERAIDKQPAASGKPTDFWHLQAAGRDARLRARAAGHAPAGADPGRYGLEFSRIANEPYFVPITTGGQIDLQVVADIAGISADDLYDAQSGLPPLGHRSDRAVPAAGPGRCRRGPRADAGAADTRTAHARRALHGPARRHGREHRRALQHQAGGDPRAQRARCRRSPRHRRRSARAVDATCSCRKRSARAAMLVDSPVRLRNRRHVACDLTSTSCVVATRSIASPSAWVRTSIRLPQANGMQPGDRLHAGQRLRVGSSTLNADAALVPARSAHAAHASGTMVAASDGSRRVDLHRAPRRYALQHRAAAAGDGRWNCIGWNGMQRRSQHLHPGQIWSPSSSSRS